MVSYLYLRLTLLLTLQIQKKTVEFLYFVDRASRYSSMLTTNLKHFFILLFITIYVVYNFIHYYLCYLLCINTIRSPDDEHLMLETCREV